MTSLREAIDYTTLGWVKPELDETLRQARMEIEGFAQDPADVSRMRFCASYLHQVQGTLRMVELYAPAMVAEEMEQLAQALQNNEATDRDAACATLMRGVVLLPDYLERLQSGHKDIPIVLLPLLNELRAARGETGLSESVLFAPDLARPLPPSLPRAPAERGAPKPADTMPLVERLSAAVATWPESGAPADAAELVSAIDALIGFSSHEETQRMLWVASAAAGALRDGALQPTPSLRQAFASVQREARRQFEDDGFGIPRPETALEPTRQLLYHVAHSAGTHPALQQLRDTFDLDAQLPTESELSHAQGSLSGRNRALLDTVSAAVKEDLLRVKDVLDLHLRTNESDVSGLQAQVEALGRVADTLGMLGLGVARNVVQQQRDAMQAIVKGDRSADEGALLDVAGALLYVDATLDDQVARLGDSDDGSSQTDLFSSESRKLLETIAREAIANFADARQAFVAFVETSWDHAELGEVPRLLQEVAGALTMLEFPQPAAYLAGVRMYIENELIGRRRVPNGRQLDTFADALASLEYYLEALRENRFNRDDILDIARNSLETLGYWPLPDAQDASSGGDSAAFTDRAQSASPLDPVDIDNAVAALIDRPVGSASTSRSAPARVDAPEPSSVPTPQPETAVEKQAIAVGQGPGGFEATGDEIDDEIREVFLEEFGEEIDNLDTLLPTWREQPADLERLRTIRRVFHTLKGSGRLVGARALGEFSWKVENMLNRVLDGTRPASPAVVAMVDNAFYTLPQLHAALRGQGAVSADLAGMQALADRVADGEEVFGSMSVAEAAANAQADATASADEPQPLESAAVSAPPDSLPASVDALLLEILDAEVAGHLSTVDAWLSQARTGPLPVSDALLRATHTMNGAFAMTEVPAITDALGPAETYIRRLFATKSPPSAEGVAAIGKLADLVRTTVVALHATSPHVPTCVVLAAQLVALRDSLPESRAPAVPVIDDDEHEREEETARAALDPAADVEDASIDARGDDFALTDIDLSDYGDLAGSQMGPADGAAAGKRASRDDAGLPASTFTADRPVDPFAADASDDADATPVDVADAATVASAEGDSRSDLDDDAGVDTADAGTAHIEQSRHEAGLLDAIRIQEEARLLAEQQAVERAEADLREVDRLEAERFDSERVESERVEAERLDSGRLESGRIEAERFESERLETEPLATGQTEHERLEDDLVESEQLQVAPTDAEVLASAPQDSAPADIEVEESDAAITDAADVSRFSPDALIAALNAGQPVQAEATASPDVEEASTAAELREPQAALGAPATPPPAQTAAEGLSPQDFIAALNFGPSTSVDTAMVADATTEDASAAILTNAATDDASAEAAPAGLERTAVEEFDRNRGEDVLAETDSGTDRFAETAQSNQTDAPADGFSPNALIAALNDGQTSAPDSVAQADAPLALDPVDAADHERVIESAEATEPAQADGMPSATETTFRETEAHLSPDDLVAALNAAHPESVEVDRTAEEVTPAAPTDEERFAAEHAEAARIAEEDEREYARLELEYAEADRLAREQAQAETDRVAEEGRVAAERAEAARAEAERVEAERVDAERAEAERGQAERRESERLDAGRIEADRLEAARREAAQVEAQRLETERVEAERVEAERIEANKLESERLEAERFEVERLASERHATEYDGSSDAHSNPTDASGGASPDRDAIHVNDIAATALAAGAIDPEGSFDLTGLDPELVDIFIEEAGDLLDHSDGLLAKLRDAPGEREPLVGLQRDLHTIKGGARMAGIMAVGELGHAMESLLEAVVENRSELGHDGVPLLERGFDRLHAMVTRVSARQAIDPSDALIVEFNERASGRRARESASVDDAPTMPVRVPAPKVELKPLSAPINDGTVADEDDIGVRAPQEQVRIRADLLDRLVTYAGEVAIYRARLEQQLGAFRTAMGEMGQTNMRLRDQLRRLDIETEAQIIARYQREGDQNDATFDPLELDRFSTLQQLSRALGESAADMSSLQGTLDDLTRQYETLLLQQSRVSSDLQEGLMRTRMVPFDALVPRLRRVVRQASGDTGKQVQLKLDGAQGELDRNVLERMTAPLEHMLRNAVAHGLESPEQRKHAKKPDEGVVRIAVRREGSEVVLEVSDDGRGLDRAAIRRRGEERGLVRMDAVVADGDLDTLIFEPGFSTADEVSRLAGRGVGMDVVASEVRQLGGTLDIRSKQGEGTTFTLRLPQTLAVTQAVFVRIGETSFAVPIASVRGAGRLSREDFDKPGASYAYGGEDYVVHDLGGLVGHGAAKADGQLQMPVLLIRSGDLRAAVAVDQIVGNREIVVKPVGPQVASIPGIFGATVMGDGSVVVILDIAPLVRRQATLPRDIEPVAPVESRHVPLVMVVDDSVTMRKVTGRILERHNFEVASARDGIDALERMAERVPDLMLLDIEMPRMDGYELATAMKADPRLRDVPIVMITSRTGEKHRQRAFEIGVERYLGKPYQENELVRNVYELLKLELRHDG